MEKNDKITLGSGDLYMTEFNDVIPADEILEVDANLLGEIKGGATLEYKADYYTCESDLGRVSKTVMTKEEASIKTGTITWNGDTLQKMCATARVLTEGTTTVIKIGGLKNQNGKSYVVRFVQKDEDDNTILRVTIVGTNQNGLILAFAKEKETQVDAVFKAQKSDSEGTLVTISMGVLKPETVKETNTK